MKGNLILLLSNSSQRHSKPQNAQQTTMLTSMEKLTIQSHIVSHLMERFYDVIIEKATQKLTIYCKTCNWRDIDLCRVGG